jgi:hypothetical protein
VQNRTSLLYFGLLSPVDFYMKLGSLKLMIKNVIPTSLSPMFTAGPARDLQDESGVGRHRETDSADGDQYSASNAEGSGSFPNRSSKPALLKLQSEDPFY